MSRTYDLALTEWITVGLNKQTLDKTIDIVENNKSLDPKTINNFNANKLYIEKILREEVIKQFSDNRRPVLEVILNSIDARPQNSKDSYKIDIVVDKREFISEDNGKGMSLDEVLRLLIIPFSTEKKPIDDIGRFGVGFLSTFNYCISEPKKNKIIVETKKDNTAYKIVFYATGEHVGDIRMKVQKTRKRNNGTKVYINAQLTRHFLMDYLHSSLRNIPDYIAKISLNDTFINVINNKWYSSPAKMHILDKDIVQPVGLVIGADNLMLKDKEKDDSETIKAGMIRLTAQGVLVKEKYNNGSNCNMIISFPPAIQLVEGRDQFKINDNYYSCVNAAFRALEDHIDTNDKNRTYTAMIADLIPPMMSILKISELKTIPNMDSIRKKLFGDKEYVVNINETDELIPFYGSVINSKSFVTTAAACNYWEEYYGNSKAFINTLNNGFKSMTSAAFIGMLKSDKLEQYPNMRALLKCSWFLEEYNVINLVSLDASGETAFLHEADRSKYSLTINTKHPNFEGPFSYNKVYLTLADYFNTAKRANVLSKIKNIDIAESYLQTALEEMPANKRLIIEPEENYNGTNKGAAGNSNVNNGVTSGSGFTSSGPVANSNNIANNAASIPVNNNTAANNNVTNNNNYTANK